MSKIKIAICIIFVGLVGLGIIIMAPTATTPMFPINLTGNNYTEINYTRGEPVPGADIYIEQEPEENVKVSGSRGGFAVGGFNSE